MINYVEQKLKEEKENIFNIQLMKWPMIELPLQRRDKLLSFLPLKKKYYYNPYHIFESFSHQLGLKAINFTI